MIKCIMCVVYYSFKRHILHLNALYAWNIVNLSTFFLGFFLLLVYLHTLEINVRCFSAAAAAG